MRTATSSGSKTDVGLILETSRLFLREMGMDDLPAVAKMLADPCVMQYWPRPYNEDEAVQWVERQHGRYEKEGHGYWLMIQHDSGAVIGQAGLITQELGGIQELSVGWIVRSEFWRQGFAIEAAEGCIKYAFEQLSARKVVAPIRPENIPSVRLAEKLGMVWERQVEYAGFVHDIYALSASPRRRAAT